MKYIGLFLFIGVFLMTGCNNEDSSTPKPTSVDISEALGTYSFGLMTVTDLQGEVLA